MKKYILHLFETHVGARNPISKKELMQMTNLDERTVRRLIKELYYDGFMIIATSSGSGYYLSNDVLEVQKYLNDMTSRRDKLNENIQIAKDWMAKRQPTINADVVMTYEQG